MGRHRLPKNHADFSPAFTLPHPAYIIAPVAVVTVLGGVSGFVFNTSGQPDSVQAQASHGPEKQEPNSPRVEHSDKYSDDQVVTSVVDLYNNVCPPLGDLSTVANDMAVTVEESIGKEGDDLSGFWKQSLGDKAGKLYAAADVLDKNSGSDNISRDAVNKTTAKTREVADAFRGYGDAINKDNVGDTAGQARMVAANQGDELADLVQELVDSAPFPTTATADTVHGLEVCKGVFTTGPQLADGQTVDAALDFHKRVKQGKDEVDKTRGLLDQIEVDEGAEPVEIANKVADVWAKRAEAAEAAERRMNEWVFPEALTPAELSAMSGYEDSKRDAAFVWHELAKSAREQEGLLRGSGDGDALDENLTVAADRTWEQDVAEEKMLVRVDRVASGGRG